MEEKVGEFRRVLQRKKRYLVLTHHAEMRAAERQIENRLIQTDLLEGNIQPIRETLCEMPDERVFDVHVIATDGQPMRYVLAINNLIRVITLMKIGRIKPKELT